jgi:hypothetical protein
MRRNLPLLQCAALFISGYYGGVKLGESLEYEKEFSQGGS